ncbi:MAG: response regulator [Betaproteobacteria bacterium]
MGEMMRGIVPDVVLLDIGLPVMDGYSLAKRLRGDSRFRDVRVIALTGFGQGTIESARLDSGFDDHLVKPVAFELLRSKIEAG